jgi:peptidoglycan LD-endopeptidase CwlK
MYSFGAKSQERMAECDIRLQVVMKAAIKHMDFSVICGNRDEEAQMAAYNAKPQLSRAKFGQSPHNYVKSYAVDIAPYPIDWADLERFCFLGGLMKGIAAAHGIPLTWGYDWNNNGILVKDDPAESLKDAPHFEITNWKQELENG